MITGFFPGSPIGDPANSVLAVAAFGGVIVEPSGMLRATLSLASSTDTVPVYDRGDREKFQIRITDAVTGDYVSASGLLLHVRKPGGALDSYVPTQDDIGLFSVTLVLNLEGRWRYRWEGDGVNEQGMLVVRPTRSD